MTPQEYMAEYERRSALRTFDAMAELIADDAVYFFNDGTYRGLEAIRGAFEATWAHEVRDESYAIEDIRWVAEGPTVAVCTYRFRWEGAVGEETARRLLGLGRGTQVLRQDGDRWRTVHEHLSAEPRAA
jgi:ketosteroid isomerase-like protein